jgi:hypothetical protein
MSWTLNHQQVTQPELLDAFFLAAGKDLCFANAFEAKCKYILRMINLTEYSSSGGDISESATLAKLFKSKQLGLTIKGVGTFPDFSPEDIALIERAKDARNFVAHGSAFLAWPITTTRARFIHERINQLRSEVGHLVVGDNLVSRGTCASDTLPRLSRASWALDFCCS